TVTPEARAASWALPTRRPATSVMRLRGAFMGAGNPKKLAFTSLRLRPSQAFLCKSKTIEAGHAQRFDSSRDGRRPHQLLEPLRPAAGAALSVLPCRHDLRPAECGRRGGAPAGRP